MNWPQVIILETGKWDPVKAMTLLMPTLLSRDQNAGTLAPRSGLLTHYLPRLQEAEPGKWIRHPESHSLRALPAPDQ